VGDRGEQEQEDVEKEPPIYRLGVA